MWYLMYRVMTGLNTNIEYSFVTVGHTKFSCDRCFGVFKKKVNRTPLHTLYNVATICEESGDCNSTQLVGTHDGQVFVECFDWTRFLSDFFRKIPQVTSYDHFYFTSKEPGVIKYSAELNQDLESFNLMKRDAPPFRGHPVVYPPRGFVPEREEYLFNEIREFCAKGTEDLVAPAPTNKRPCN